MATSSGIWVNPSPDASRQDLAAPSGATLVGTPEGTTQDALDGRVKTVELSDTNGALLVGTPDGTLLDALAIRVKADELAAPTGAGEVGFQQADGPALLRTLLDKGMDTKSFRDYITNAATDNWLALQAAIDALPSGAVLDVTSTLISDALLITKPITLRASGAGSTITQLSWGKPNFLVDQASDLTLQGHFALRYDGARTLISSLPTSTDARIQAIYTAVGTAPGNPRTLAAGIYLRQKCDRFRADYLSVYGQVIGMIQANANVYANYSDECSVGQLDVDTVDWGYLSGGFKRLSFGVINAKNITSTQGDPPHAVYFGPRTVRNGILSIGELNVDGCTIIIDASDQLRAADAFSIRGTELVSIGSINIRNAQYLGNFQDGRFVVGSISGVLLPLLSGTLSADLAVPFAVQNNADVTIGQWNVESALGWDAGRQPSFFVSTSSGGKVRINGGTHRMTGAKPGNFARNSSGTLDTRGLDLKYTNEFDAAYPNPAAYLVTTTLGTGSTLITDPSLEGTERLLLAPAANADWRIWLNQQKLALNTPNTVIDASGSYHINFMSWPDVPPVAPAFTGTGAVQMRSRAVLGINNAAGASIAACHSGCTPNQEYMLTCADNFTTIQHNANITTKTGIAVPVGWKWFLYRVVGTMAYEISRA